MHHSDPAHLRQLAAVTPGCRFTRAPGCPEQAHVNNMVNLKSPRPHITPPFTSSNNYRGTNATLNSLQLIHSLGQVHIFNPSDPSVLG
eukprot:4402644-Pyramimonas_sp.AAC.1